MSDRAYSAGRLVRRVFWGRRQSQTSAVIRFGRVLHWIAAIAAMLALLIGFLIQLDVTARANEYYAYRRAHPETYADGLYNLDPGIPYPVEYDYTPLLGGLAAALVILLLGRAIRYILADE
jgi:hypothetical protein